MRQGEHESLQDYHEQFKNHMAMMGEIGASFADTTHIGEIALKNGHTTANSNDVDVVTEFRQPLQVQSHLEVPRILVQLGHIQRT